MLKISRNCDIKKNPGPGKRIKTYHFTICHWNLYIITAHGYTKVSLLKAYITAHKMDIISLLEIYLDSSIQSNNDNLEIPRYSLVCSNHLSINKRGNVCICYKASLPLIVIDICFLQECITFEVMIGDKKCNFVALNRPPSQNQDQFDSFSKNVEITLDKLALTTLLCLQSLEIKNMVYL